MYSTLPRMMASITLMAYLLVGVVAYRLVSPETTTITFNSQYFSYFSRIELAGAEVREVEAPSITFQEIKIPEVKIVVAKKITPPVVRVEKIAGHELPFHDYVKLHAIQMSNQLPTDMVALYKDLAEEVKTEMVAAAAKPVIDEVSTKLAKTEEVEAEFFDYPVMDEPGVAVVMPKASTAKVVPEPVVANKEIVEPIVTDVVEPEFFDYPAQAPKTEVVATAAPVVKQQVTVADYSPQASPEKSSPEEVVEVNDLIGFDYSKAQADVTNQTIPTVSKVTTQPVAASVSSSPAPVVKQDEKADQKSEKNALIAKNKKEEKNLLKTNKFLGAELSVRAVGTNFKDVQDLRGFEVRFADDPTSSIQDDERGEVIINERLSAEKMTRTITLLKPGFAPTSSEVVIENGYFAMSLPLIEEKTLQIYQGNGSSGAVLVNLDGITESVEIDVPYKKVINLDEDLAKTRAKNARYQLFLGVRPGNIMINFRTTRGEQVAKIMHVHANEVTYELNVFESIENSIISLNEEDLLSRETSPLMTSSEQVSVFGTNLTAKKVSDRLYKMKFEAGLSGARRYLQLNHREEPIFVGIRNSNKVLVPSESFMRHILSNLEGSNAQRCMVQVNLRKKVLEVVSGTESASDLLVSTQYLDYDGKFYDSASEKTRKILFVGESRGHEKVNPDSKINVQIKYQDGSVEFLGSYCSPNTYLVEQL